MVNLTSGVDFLREQLATKETSVNKLNAEVMALRQAIAILEGASPDELPKVQDSEYRDMGITAAAKRFLREMGEPQDTRSIADALLRKGLQTNSKNFIATIYATLNNGKQWFRRTSDGRWALRELDRGQAS